MEKYKDKLINLLKKKLKGDISLSVPPDPSLGDYSLACFPFAKELKKNPQEIAEDLSKSVKADFIEKIETKGAYLNFFLDKKQLVKDILHPILKGDEKKESSKERFMVEFSQANTHKAFHVGHVRGTSLGESLARILEYTGKKVVRANYQGDTGMHVAKWIWCYQNYHKKEKLKDEEEWISGIYVDAISRLTQNPKLQEGVDEVNRKIDSGEDKKLQELWKKTRRLSLDAFERIYKELNTTFDHYFFESTIEKKAKKICQELIKKNIAEISDGATIINLEKYNLGVSVLLRKDGTVLYSAKDLALAEEKFTKYRIDDSIYVVGKEQEFYFRQLFKTLALMKFKQAEKLRYVPVSLVKLPHGKMSSRTGDNILYSSFKDELKEYAASEIKKRFKVDKKELERRSLAIAIASLKYSMLKQHPNKEIVFNKEEAMRFEGDTGPYLLYSYARASSIIRKAKSKGKLEIDELTDKEIVLAKKLGMFRETVEKAGQQLQPGLIANYAFQLSQLFNEFYAHCQVVGSEAENFRLALVEGFRIVLKKALDLLGIDVIEQM
ncbi:arginine--tRNA ligase [Candidatus Woesearchaeota archaeon]|nr:arginine--tRNA ligase [Candidatus Woesearchaeota archaeon]